MVMCWAPNCTHYNVREKCKFYTFPTDKKTRSRWIKLIRRKEEPGSGARMCSCHFLEGNKVNGPTIFDHNVSKLFTPHYLSPEIKQPKRELSLEECSFCKRRCTEGIGSYSFPEDEHLCNGWLMACRFDLHPKNNTSNLKLCSRHFTEDCFFKTSSGRMALKHNAFPTLLQNEIKANKSLLPVLNYEQNIPQSLKADVICKTEEYTEYSVVPNIKLDISKLNGKSDVDIKEEKLESRQPFERNIKEEQLELREDYQLTCQSFEIDIKEEDMTSCQDYQLFSFEIPTNTPEDFDVQNFVQETIDLNYLKHTRRKNENMDKRVQSKGYANISEEMPAPSDTFILGK